MISTSVCVDTGILTSLLRPGSILEQRYRQHLVGRRLLIPVQVVTEALYGAAKAGWGPRRRAELQRLLRRGPVAVADEATARAHATLRIECERSGHPLHQKAHGADLWIAATAVRYGVALVTDDRIFSGCPGLHTVTETL